MVGWNEEAKKVFVSKKVFTEEVDFETEFEECKRNGIPETF